EAIERKRQVLHQVEPGPEASTRLFRAHTSPILGRCQMSRKKKRPGSALPPTPAHQQREQQPTKEARRSPATASGKADACPQPAAGRAGHLYGAARGRTKALLARSSARLPGRLQALLAAWGWLLVRLVAFAIICLVCVPI